MTLLISNKTSNSKIIRNYTITSSQTTNIVASTTNASYMKGSVFIRDLTDSLFFDYSITNFNGILKSTIFGMIGKEFDIVIADFVSGNNVGLVITNNEAFTLNVSLIQEL